jgi:hypothetical protein
MDGRNKLMLAKCVADYGLRGLNERAPVVLEM